ncbi:MAG TPA: hypothetical protein VN026_06670 [Bacteroidia bacterium]|jgi:hypothetical protein|nr:hypothetical protein [Bacteroidia bacterium]
MRIAEKKGMILRRVIALNILIFSSLVSLAGFTDKAKNALSREFNSFEGIWIILGLLGGGLGFYFLMSYINKKNAEKEAAQEAANPHHHVHHRRRHKHRVVKKTS